MDKQREVFRIENYADHEGAFWSGAIGHDWPVIAALPGPGTPGELLIEKFLDEYGGVFAFLSAQAILFYLSKNELHELYGMGFVVSVFLVTDNAKTSAFSETQVVFDLEQAQWLRFMSLIDL